MYTIMVVDDSPFIVDVFVTMLERGGYRTVAAYGGEECLDLLRTASPDLILLDIIMEPLDGWETLRRIKEDPRTKDIPVVMLTGKQITPSEALEYGIFIEDYLQKPVTHRELCEAIEHVLGRRQAIQAAVAAAQASGFDPQLIGEYAWLSRSLDVNRRLVRILRAGSGTDGRADPVSDGISPAIERMEAGIRVQEGRLREIRDGLSGALPELPAG